MALQALILPLFRYLMAFMVGIVFCLVVITSNQLTSEPSVIVYNRYSEVNRVDYLVDTARVTNGSINHVNSRPSGCVRPPGEASSGHAKFKTCKYPKYFQPSCPQNTFQPMEQAQIYVYSAFYTEIKHRKYGVMIIGFIGSILKPVYCVLDYGNGTTISVAGYFEGIKIPEYQKFFKYIPTMIWCPEPLTERPVSVSVTDTYCGETSNKLIIMDRSKSAEPANDTIGICMKHIFNYTSPYSLTEWMEMQKMMGVTQVILYDYDHVAPSIKRLLDYYSKDNFLSIHPWQPRWRSSRLPQQGGEIHTHGQFAMINDCLYRYGHKFKYLLFIDPDEYVIPSSAVSFGYLELFRNVLYNPRMAGRTFRHTLFCVPMPVEQSTIKNPHTQLYTGRREPTLTYQTKPVVHPAAVRSMGVHDPLLVRPGYIGSFDVPVELAKLHHYRYKKGMDNLCPISDSSALRYGKDLRLRMKRTLQKIGISSDKVDIDKNKTISRPGGT